MNDAEPRLELGSPPGKLARANRPRGGGLLFLVVILQLALLALFLFGMPRGPSPAGTADPDRLRAVALDLEDRGLLMESAGQWEAYLAAAPDAPDRAQVFYRAGTLYLKVRAFEKAAAAFIRAERAPECDSDLKAKIGPKMVECLRGAGLHGEVGRELARRTTVGDEGEGGDRILATFAGESFTEADLERLIAFRVDRLLGLQGAAGSGAQRAQLIAQMSDPKVREQVFMEILRMELLSRRARELKLDQTDGFRNALALAEQELLAAMLYEQELGAITAAPVDVEAFFNANREDYSDEETGEVPAFEEAAERAAADYVSRKRTEIAESLLNDLMARYDVRIEALPAAREETAADREAPAAAVEGTTSPDGTQETGEGGKER